MRAALVAALAAPAGAWREGTSSADLRRAFRPRPHKESHVAAETPEGVFASMNRHLTGGAAATSACEEWEHEQLNALLRELNAERDTALDAVYAKRNDKRAIHFDAQDLEYKEALWVEERLAGSAGSAGYNLTRDGKCSELVMWWVHHLPQRARAKLADRAGFRIPRMPAAGPALDHVAAGKATREYIYQVQCISCHLSMPCRMFADNETKGQMLLLLCPNTSAQATPRDEPKFDARVGFPPQTCPPNPKTGKPWVFYNRTKRCEWDFDPPCGMCEGVGGPIWGDGEDEWRPAYCKPLLKPEDIPKDNITNPVWPKAFTSTEYTCGNWGAALDPCSPKDFECKDGNHGGWIQYYHQRNMSELPVPADGTWPLTGMQPEQRQDIPAKVGTTKRKGASTQWTLPNGNMFNTMPSLGNVSHTTCMCFSEPNMSPRKNCSDPGCDPHPGGPFSPGASDPFKNADNVLLGPLRWDFASDSVLIGREEIELEYSSWATGYSSKRVVADHWLKGSDHFWYEVSTNLMVRQHQVESALTIHTNWTIGEPDPSVWVIPKSCYSGPLQNLSCVSPPPVAAP